MLVYPRKVNLSFDTLPSGLTLYLDGIAKTTPFVYDTLIGFNHTIEARNQVSGATSYTFASWSDGGAQTHTIVVPTTNQSYVATFQASAAARRPSPPTPSTRERDDGRRRLRQRPHRHAHERRHLGRGKYGSALHLDGSNDYVDLGNPAALQLTGSMTVSAWINSAAFPGDDAAIVSKRTAGEVGFQLDTTIDRGPRTIGFKLTSSSGGPMFRYGATTLQAQHLVPRHRRLQRRDVAAPRLPQRPTRRRRPGRHGHLVAAEPNRQREHRPTPHRPPQVQRPDRRHPHLQLGTERRPDPDGHDDAGWRGGAASCVGRSVDHEDRFA